MPVTVRYMFFALFPLLLGSCSYKYSPVYPYEYQAKYDKHPPINTRSGFRERQKYVQESAKRHSYYKTWKTAIEDVYGEDSIPIALILKDSIRDWPFGKMHLSPIAYQKDFAGIYVYSFWTSNVTSAVGIAYYRADMQSVHIIATHKRDPKVKLGYYINRINQLVAQEQLPPDVAQKLTNKYLVPLLKNKGRNGSKW